MRITKLSAPVSRRILMGGWGMFALAAMMTTTTPAAAQSETLSLVGKWQFRSGTPKPEVKQGALPSLTFEDTITLPGTTDTRRKGPEQGPGWNGALTRVYKFEGPAWYRREVTIPEAWRGKRISLFLERTKYTQVWLEQRPLGESPILCTPHEYVLEGVQPGRHVLTILVDNTRKPVPGDMHQMSDNTQGNWNGILGRVELRATDPVWLDDVQVYSEVPTRTVTVRVRLGNSGGRPGRGTLSVRAKGKGVAAGVVRTAEVAWTANGATAEIQVPLGASAALWDEFHPSLHKLRIALEGEDGVRDERKVMVGLRDFAAPGPQFTVNGRTTFLRGKHDACVFPLTGHPPMDVEGWLRYFRICRDYGINLVRFHTWTPPEAAFTAADQVGMYLQPELPFWGDFTEDVKTALKPEGERILRYYGNHPSFVMFALGNENRNSREIMGSLVSELRAQDNRRLYAQGSNNFMWDPQLPAGDDYLVTARVKNSPQSPSRNVRGSHATVDRADGHVQAGPAAPTTDYREAIAGIPLPVIGHEIGQYTVYPKFSEIRKYTGVMRAHNFEHYRERLRSAGMIDQADDFARASGKLAALNYREEIEGALRTPGFGGFQLLDLQDFPGQGTALVGMLDAFMDSKGILTPEEWRQFCAPVVLLARFPRYTWEAGETFRASIEVAHYGEKDLSGAEAAWTLRDLSGKTVAAGKLPSVDAKQGGIRRLGELDLPLPTVTEATRFTLDIRLAGSDVRTSYPLWVYPTAKTRPGGATAVPPPGIVIARTFDAAARAALDQGKSVVLVADGKRPLAHSVGGGFTTDFWNWPMFHNKPGTMGLLCDPAHPALNGFPTEYHSNWQWFHLAVNSQPLVLDDLPTGYRPIVQVIDNMERVHRLGMVFETSVGRGKLLVCATDLLAMDERPEARELLHSLLRYAASDSFHPQVAMPMEKLIELLRTTVPMVGKATASSREPGWQAWNAEQASDGNADTVWRAEEKAKESWWRFDFATTQDLNGAEILWEKDQPGYQYIVEGTTDGATWQTLSDQRKNAFPNGRHRIAFTATGIRSVRVTITGAPGNGGVGIREFRLFPPE